MKTETQENAEQRDRVKPLVRCRHLWMSVSVSTSPRVIRGYHWCEKCGLLRSTEWWRYSKTKRFYYKPKRKLMSRDFSVGSIGWLAEQLETTTKEKVMKCPHCEYEHNQSFRREDEIIGKHGEFYATRIQMERDNGEQYYNELEREEIYACPACRKMFISGDPR